MYISIAILLVVWLRCQGIHVSCLEISGVLISFTGLAVSNVKELLSPAPPVPVAGERVVGEAYQLLGMALCFLSAICEVGVLSNRIRTKNMFH